MSELFNMGLEMFLNILGVIAGFVICGGALGFGLNELVCDRQPIDPKFMAILVLAFLFGLSVIVGILS